MGQTQNKYKSLLSILFVFAIIFGFAFAIPMTVSADEPEASESIVKRIIEETLFIGYKKGESEGRGKHVIACFYVPNSVYDSDCTYGAAIYPRLYEDRYDVHGDYIAAFAEKNATIVNLEAQNIQEAPEGKIFRLGMGNIRESNVSYEFAYVFYAMDAAGNIAYFAPQYAAYTTLNARDLTDEELLALAEQKIQMKDNFGQLANKVSELVDSVWIYLVIALGSVVVIWGAYIGIRIAVAKKNEQKIDAKAMVKRLVIGIIVMFVMAGGLPLLIKGLAAWTGG